MPVIAVCASAACDCRVPLQSPIEGTSMPTSSESPDCGASPMIGLCPAVILCRWSYLVAILSGVNSAARIFGLRSTNIAKGASTSPHTRAILPPAPTATRVILSGKKTRRMRLTRCSRRTKRSEGSETVA
jgi:hypothetical protein